MRKLIITGVTLSVFWIGTALAYAQEVRTMSTTLKNAYFAGGCFWCMEPPFEQLEGVQAVIAGYTGGKIANPTYKQVASGLTEHIEAVKIVYDPTKIGYKDLLNVFWRQIDPTDVRGQFVDRGHQYSTAIFYETEEERELAEQSKQELVESGWFTRPIVTTIRKFDVFYEAEEYHQDYYKKNSFRYKFYRSGSGRDQYLADVWGDEADDSDQIPPKP